MVAVSDDLKSHICSPKTDQNWCCGVLQAVMVKVKANIQRKVCFNIPTHET